MTYRFLFSVRVTIIVAGAFLFAQTVTAATDSIIITEIGSAETSGREWVEIYNNGSTAVDLTQWKFWEGGVNHGLSLIQGEDAVIDAGEYAIITQKDDEFMAAYPAVAVTIFDSSWGSLKESGEEIGLKDGEGVVVEQFTYVAASNFSLERADYDLADYTSANWQEHAGGNTVGTQNSNVAQSSSGTVRINEFVSNPIEGESEWIELFHESSGSIDLSGWVIEDGVGVIATLDQSFGAGAYIVIDLVSSKLNNGGDSITVKNAAGEVVDQIVYGNWDDGDVSDNVLAPAKGESLSYVGSAFVQTAASTKGALNQTSVGEDVLEAPQITAPISARSIEASTIVINEFVSDPADDGVEFIELYNRSTRVINLSGWWIEDGGESKTLLSGTMEARSFFVVENPAGRLNNAGDRITLFESNGLVIDQVVYGNWDDGRVYNNADVARDPNSVARKQDGLDSDIDSNDFAQTSIVTKGTANQFPEVKKSVTSVYLSDSGQEIVISEIFPNPIGPDGESEFIELHNTGLSIIDLTGWQLGDSSSKRFTIQDMSIDPDSYIAFLRSDTQIALNNTGGDSVTLFSPEGKEVERISYEGQAIENRSYVKDETENWVWSAAVTPGEENTIEIPNEDPIGIIESSDEGVVGEPTTFDASDSIDVDGNIVLYTWYFGDATTSSGSFVQHAYVQPGVYTITLRVQDAASSTTEITKKITVKPRRRTAVDYENGIRISEIVANPAGLDDAEFIELYNSASTSVDISGLKLDDEDGGSHPFVIPEQIVLQAGEYRIFKKEKTGLSLNNTQDSVRLLYPDDTVMQEVTYVSVVEGASYIPHGGVWVWTSAITPGEANRFVAIVKKQKATKKAKKVVKKVIANIALSNIRNYDSGDRVSVTGTVAVLPGVFGSQYFYIIGDDGVQVYQNKKDFPTMEVGDSVKVSGSLSQAYGELRLKTSTKEDIIVVASGQIIVSQPLDVVEIGELYEGQLVKVAGEITELKSSYMYLDDGTEEIKVYFKKGTGIVKKSYTVGQMIEVVGIVSERNGVYQILPRASEDIVIQGMRDEPELIITSAGNTNKDVAEKYLTATAGGLTSIFIGLFARARGATALGFARRIGFVAVGSVKRWIG